MAANADTTITMVMTSDKNVAKRFFILKPRSLLIYSLGILLLEMRLITLPRERAVLLKEQAVLQGELIEILTITNSG